ncbi:MAG: class I SAM-dependent methyltransferase [Candidatus Omnitrophica bacterium]|nr:class I SAM-dependent methyltransferase [Candidatus Omnitrophota bacterium]
MNSSRPEGSPKEASQTGFNDSYAGTPPWDIARPQKEILALDDAGLITGRVLDAGCGTGAHSLYFAKRGHESWGIDYAPAAIEKARKKAAEQKIQAAFRVADALELTALGRQFNTIIDCGLFHCLSDADRVRYAKSLSQALATGGHYFMLCFSEHEPAEWGGPRRVTQQEIRDTFPAADGWCVDFIREAVFETNFHPQGGKAWMTKITKE